MSFGQSSCRLWAPTIQILCHRLESWGAHRPEEKWERVCRGSVALSLLLHKESQGGWVGEQVGLQSKVWRPDSLHLIQRLKSSVQTASFMIHKLRTVKNMSVQTQEGPQWCISSYMERKRKVILGFKVKLPSINRVQYTACNLTNPSSMWVLPVGSRETRKRDNRGYLYRRSIAKPKCVYIY